MKRSYAMTGKIFLLFAIVGSIVAADSEIVDRSTFSGIWKADIARSDFGAFTAPQTFTRVIMQDDLRLTITVDAVDGKGKSLTGELRMSLDGEESINEVGGRQVKAFARRLGSHMLVQTSREWEGMSLVIYELWSLVNDGQELIVEGVITTSMGEEDLRVVLVRQSD